MDGAGRTLTLVDLFAGCGGLSLGMEFAGFEPVFVSELNEDALATYLANRHHLVGGKPFSEQVQLHSRDAHELQGERLEKLVSDLRSLGLTFPSPEEAAGGAGPSNLDLIAGGPPCQGYSGIGHRRSYPVHREKVPSNQLYQRMAAIIERLRPRVFLFENVQGLLTARWTPRGKKIWPDIVDRFKAIPDYDVRWSVVRASEYGVPQNRPRVLLVGVRSDITSASALLSPNADPVDAFACGFLPRGTQSPPDLKDVLGDLIDPAIGDMLQDRKLPSGQLRSLSYPAKASHPVQVELRTRGLPAAANELPLSEHEYSRHSPEIIDKFEYMIRNGGEIPSWAATKKFNQRVLLPEWDERGPTITATSLPDDYVHFAQPRILTVREWARLQTFPDWYQFKGKRTTGGLRRAGNPHAGLFEREVPKYTQIGNAVPVRLAEAIGLHLKSVIASAVDGSGVAECNDDQKQEMAA